jgi:hypothetical protein
MNYASDSVILSSVFDRILLGPENLDRPLSQICNKRLLVCSFAPVLEVSAMRNRLSFAPGLWQILPPQKPLATIALRRYIRPVPRITKTRLIH